MVSAMNRPVRIGGHTAEAGRIAALVLGNQKQFTPGDARLAWRITFWLHHDPKVIRRDVEINEGLARLHDELIDAGLL